jgi:hypothetical protein
MQGYTGKGNGLFHSRMILWVRIFLHKITTINSNYVEGKLIYPHAFLTDRDANIVPLAGISSNDLNIQCVIY